MARTPEEAARFLDRLGDAVASPLPPDALEELGQFATALVVRRVKKGLDPDHRAFVPYSGGYADARAVKGYEATPVDLTRTGHMLGAIGPTVEGDAVRIHLSAPREAEKMSFHDGGTRRGLPRREVMDIRHPDELRACAEVIGGKYEIRARKFLAGGK